MCDDGVPGVHEPRPWLHGVTRAVSGTGTDAPYLHVEDNALECALGLDAAALNDVTTCVTTAMQRAHFLRSVMASTTSSQYVMTASGSAMSCERINTAGTRHHAARGHLKCLAWHRHDDSAADQFSPRRRARADGLAKLGGILARHEHRRTYSTGHVQLQAVS